MDPVSLDQGQRWHPLDPGDDEWLDWVDLHEVGHVADCCAANVAAVSDPGQASRTRGHASWRTLALDVGHRQLATGDRP